MTICKNCGTSVESKFCGDCGQKASTKRFDFNFVFKELMDKFLPFDKGVIFTSMRLLTAPGVSMREYLAGKRANYSKPLSFTLMIIALSLVFFAKQDFTNGVQDGMGAGANEQVKLVQQKFVGFMFSNLTIMVAMLIPLMAWVSKWFFKKHSLNFAEFLVICAYYTSGSILAGMPIMIWLEFGHKSAFSGPALWSLTAVYVLYFAIAYVRFFNSDKPWLVALKAVLIYAIAYLLYILLISLGVALAIAFMR